MPSIFKNKVAEIKYVIIKLQVVHVRFLPFHYNFVYFLVTTRLEKQVIGDRRKNLEIRLSRFENQHKFKLDRWITVAYGGSNVISSISLKFVNYCDILLSIFTFWGWDDENKMQELKKLITKIIDVRLNHVIRDKGANRNTVIDTDERPSFE